MPQQLMDSTRTVRLAAEDLRRALELPDAERASRVREAKEWLLKAADDQGRASAVASEQYFSAESAAPEATVSTSEALAGIIADAQVGNTLIAAGHALNEGALDIPTRPPHALDDAILALESSPDFSKQITEALHFAAEPTHSADRTDATRTFQSRVQESLSSLVTEAREAGSKVVGNLLHIDGAQALNAVAQLGGPFAHLPEVGVFIKKGIEKIRQAMDSLMKLLDRVALTSVKEKLTQYWDHLQDGQLVDSLLAWAFNRASIDDAVSDAISRQNLGASAFDTATDRLGPLCEGFKSNMSWAKTLTGVVAAAAGLLLILPVAGAIAAYTAGAYFLILAAIVIMGRDYAGEKGLFHDGQGILGIAKSLTV